MEQRDSVRVFINGNRYDTIAAKLLGEHENVQLKRTKSRRYFFHDPLSDTVTPVTLTTAEEWARMNLSDAEYQNAFEGDQSELRKQIAVSISSDTRMKLDRRSAETGKSISQLIVEWVDSWD